MDKIREIVFENLRNADENGYFEPGEMLHGATAEEVASDMIAFAADCEELEKEELIPHVEAWLKEHKP